MSLFPAYSTGNTTDKETPDQDKQWLTNNSFSVDTSSLTFKKDVDEVKLKLNEGAQHPHKTPKKRHKAIKLSKKKKELKQEGKISKKHHKQYPVVELISDDCDLYCIDKTRRTDYLCHSTLTRPITPRYKALSKHFIGPRYKEPKQKKHNRYYMKLKKKKDDCDDAGVSEELLATKTAEEFNKSLCEASDAAEWIAFVEFQDEFFRSQQFVYRTESDRERAIKMRKLDILERAMGYNPNNEELLSFWTRIGTEIVSPDEMSIRLQKMLEDSPGRISLWLSLISVRQQSLALCTFSSVAELYKKAINCLKSIKTDKPDYRDADVLELLFHYCKFLQDCGHWEILWTILTSNIKLNFGLEIKVDFDIDDSRVKQLEDEIICVDKQPIWVTWRKVEALREGLHFLPVTEALDYPQRCVSLSDHFDFILHFHRDIHFKLIITFIMLLKVPLLPFNTTISKALFRTESIWALDSAELILSIVFSAPVASVKTDYLKFVAQISRGPQYLRNMEGQQEFLELIQTTFNECMKTLKEKQKIFLGLWWLRFNRWLCILDRHSLANLKLPAKKMKNLFKDFMKNPENRDNLLYYCEYSLFEYNQGNIEASIKTLKTLISSRPSVYQLTDELEKAALCQVYKCLCEIYLDTGQKNEAVKVLINLVIGPSPDVNLETKTLALKKYEIVITETIQELSHTPDSLELLLLPQFLLEWIHCYLWLLALSESAATAKAHYLKLNSIFNRNENLLSNYAREYLCEAIAVIFWSLERKNPLPLTQVIKDGLTQFPYNLKILSLLASKKLEEHGLWWAFKQSFLNPPTVIGCTILICVALSRKEIDKESFGNRLKSLFRQLALNEGKLSSVIHRLRLMFLFDFDHSQLDTAQVNALESCPWNKAIYMGAISVLPNKLTELTDVMIEKELRIHVTPDEIQEMRD